jgi:nucleotide-binding universal stress UspA family protein
MQGIWRGWIAAAPEHTGAMTMTTSQNPTFLVPLDGSPEAEQAVAYAQSLLPPDGDLVLLRVVSGPEDVEARRAIPSSVNEAISASKEAARQYLQSVSEQDPASLPRVRMNVAVGDPADQILQTAADERVELIVMTTHGRGAGRRAIFGSVADRVARHGTRPTLLLRGTALDQGDALSALPKRLVVPLDGSPLAERALPVAARLALGHGIPVQLIRVIALDEVLDEIWHDRQDGFLTMPEDETFEEARMDRERAADEYLAGHADRLREQGVAVHHEVLNGSPVFALLDVLQPGDLAVMTSHGRGGVRRWLLGSVAEKLVRHAQGPVLLVPAGQPTSGD